MKILPRTFVNAFFVLGLFLLTTSCMTEVIIEEPLVEEPQYFENLTIVNPFENDYFYVGDFVNFTVIGNASDGSAPYVEFEVYNERTGSSIYVTPDPIPVPGSYDYSYSVSLELIETGPYIFFADSELQEVSTVFRVER
ncbi:hypothetical protein [Xanthovirga aplysinae]|uniref:hypothetical protein n=1 Tax=Xanthovirga aplysinae TaxID=2529853 RepID=UPI0012BD7235|nr:hypothetical protein [Xanthovirga aplysinae]MTI31026.1 hypothetical protein [Xanthovirga aplysinae]